LHLGTYVPKPASEKHLLRPLTPAERIQADPHDGTVVTAGSDSYRDHDPTLLVTALEEIEARRAGLEWLLHADLLCQCLI